MVPKYSPNPNFTLFHESYTRFTLSRVLSWTGDQSYSYPSESFYGHWVIIRFNRCSKVPLRNIGKPMTGAVHMTTTKFCTCNVLGNFGYAFVYIQNAPKYVKSLAIFFVVVMLTVECWVMWFIYTLASYINVWFAIWDPIYSNPSMDKWSEMSRTGFMRFVAPTTDVNPGAHLADLLTNDIQVSQAARPRLDIECTFPRRIRLQGLHCLG